MGPALTALQSDIVLGVTLGLLTLIAALFLRTLLQLRARGLLSQGLAQVLFLPERRKWVYVLITLLGVLFVASGLIQAFAAVGTIDQIGFDVGLIIAYVGGAACMILLITVGLRPTSLTDTEREAVVRSTQEFMMLAFAPMDARNPPPPHR